MSSLYLAVGLAGVFLSVVVTGVAVDSILAKRRRALGLLRAQVAEVSSDMRERELAEPFFERALVPVIAGLGRTAKRITPAGMRDRIARQLVLAGKAGTQDPERVAAAKVFGALGGLVAGYAIAKFAGFSQLLTLGTTIFVPLFAYLLPGAGLGQQAIARQESIRKALPDTMDLLTISVEAGLGFDAAMAHVRKKVPGPLSDEIGRMLQEMQLGVSRPDAFRSLAARTDIEELKAFTLAMIQADAFGISIAKVLRSQSKELRMKRRQRAEEKAMKVPVKLLFPLIFGILPAMFVVLLGPGVIKILQNFFHISI